MTIPGILFLLFVLPNQIDSDEGSIGGIVANASVGRTPVGGANVVLRAELDGQLVPVAETTTNAQGAFFFAHLPAGERLEYVPGANRDGIHYPGRRIRLTPRRPQAHVELVVHDSVTHPNPLVIERHDIVICPELGALRVTETLSVVNPTSNCYVGKVTDDRAEPVTLRLAIPADFRQATFDKEFYGRRFSSVNGKLVTAIAWPPGRKDLRFTYLLGNESRHRLFERPLDLPCSHVRLCVRTGQPEDVACNLAPVPDRTDAEAVFESAGKALPAGHVIRVALGHLPVPWTAYGRWIALASLMGLIAVAGLMMKRRRDRPHQTAPVFGKA